MATVRSILQALESLAPTASAFEWDKVGLQFGDPDQDIARAVISLDRSLASIDFAATNHAHLLLSHHPLIFQPLDSITTNTHEGRALLKLAEYKMSFIAAHTNWDAAKGGINDALAHMLDLQDVNPFGSCAQTPMLKLLTFVPAENADAVVDACARAGAGQIGDYTRCAFMSPGNGTFEAPSDANPTVGEAGERTTVSEVRVEMVCPANRSTSVEAALRQAHPYEEPPCDWHVLKPLKVHPMGRVGNLPQPQDLTTFTAFVESKLNTKALAWGAPKAPIRTVAAVGGSADSEWRNAQAAGADVLVTGEVKQHIALEAAESGFAIIAAGHYATEQPGCAALQSEMQKAVSDVEWLLFEPGPGIAGRPL
ncbi:MAG TPA: Nif3-like dinuclear metal center hexameric protein [Fimbriimonadaceae bacterium]|nr:Nif3-like dinuclear metal center hexameric protein [Fimbriimonadaceae bacterium]